MFKHWFSMNNLELYRPSTSKDDLILDWMHEWRDFDALKTILFLTLYDLNVFRT